MEFKMEPIPAEEMYRFDSLSRLRRESIIRTNEWVVSEDKERFFINIGKMDHIPYNVRTDEKMPRPLDYWLIGFFDVIYGIETQRKDTIVSNGWAYVYFEPTNLYIPSNYECHEEELLENFRILLRGSSAVMKKRHSLDPSFPVLNAPKVKEIIF